MYTSIKRLQKSGLFKMDSQSVAGEEQSFSHFLSGLVDDSSKKDLSDYLSFLETSSGGERTGRGQGVATPKIDRVLQERKSKEDAETKEISAECYGSRLQVLEKQLSHLLRRSEESQPVQRPANPQSTGSTTLETGISTSLDVRRPQVASRSKVDSSQVSHYSKGKLKGKTGNKRSATKGHHPAGRSHRPVAGRQQPFARQQHPVARSQQSGFSTPLYSSDSDGEVMTGVWSASPPTMPTAARHIQPVSEDVQMRNQLSGEQSRPDQKDSSELNSLLVDLEGERERRWKAEQVAQKLVNHIRDLRGRESETTMRHEGLVMRAADLEQQYTQVSKEREQFLAENAALKKALGELKRALTASKEVADKQQRALQALEMSMKKQESEFLEEKANDKRQLRESEGRSDGLAREADMLKKTVKTMKGQLVQLQELLASREHQHKVEMEGRVPLQGKELQEVIRREVHRERQRTSQTIQHYKEKIAEQEEKYLSLEEEFRAALRIEAGRYKELLVAHRSLKEEIESSRQTAVDAVERERKASRMMAKLTAMVKEQKNRITELHTDKAESDKELKGMVAELEMELGTKGKLESKLEFTELENTKLRSQTLAQTSVIEGLREERQLWGKELAHQGATLAQDRGRMVSQIESLTEEVQILKEKLKNEEDCRKIKEKIIADQSDTISKLKQELVERDKEFHSELDQCRQERSAVQDHMEEMSMENQDLQSEVASLHLRKEELKESLTVVEHELEVSRDKYRKLKTSLEERARAISGLEGEMKRIKATFEGREQSLTEEKDQLESQLKVVQERFKTCDDHFRKQLALKEQAFQEKLQEELQKKDQELALERSRVAKTEGEMRDLLKEVSLEKNAMNQKMAKLSQVLGDFELNETKTL